MKVSVLIPFRATDSYRLRSLGAVYAHWTQHLHDGDEIIVDDSDDELFNRGRSRNVAFEESTGDVVVIADADTILLDETALNYAVSGVWTVPYVVPYDVYYNATQAWTECYYVDMDNSKSVSDAGMHEHRLTGTICGIIVMRRETFELVGGYDERFQGWGYEDDAFGYALDVLVGKPLRVRNSEVVHLWHPHEHAQNFGQPHIEHNRALLERYRAATDRDTMRQLIEERHAH